ncbi:MAG TPA: hypothetical protein VKZ53_08755 [Candidatus Angelobacter sp.]|nr:hypothetical protein [Candidatus Angelobacter sp.]
MLFLSRVFKAIQQWFNPKFAAGANAERTFESLCTERQYIWEPISQDQRSYRERYAKQTDYGKRGDYLIRDLNVEVEVKCLSVYERERCQYLKWNEVARLSRMQKAVKSTVVLAFFEREGRHATPDSLRMIPLDDLLPPNRKPRITYSKSRKALRIPRSAMIHGFDLLEKQLRVEQSASQQQPVHRP